VKGTLGGDARRVWAALALLPALLPAACRGRPAAVPPRSLVIVTGGTAGVYYPVGQDLARAFMSRLPDVRVEVRATPGSVFNVDALDGGEADLAMTQGDAAYAAYSHGTAGRPLPHAALRAIGVVYTNFAQVAARRDGPIRTIASLKGHRVGVGPTGSHTEVTARIVLAAHGLGPSDVHAEALAFDEAANRLRARQLDAIFVMASYPVPAIRAANEAVGIRMLPIRREVVEGIRDGYPFYRPRAIPRGTYADQDEDVETLAVDNVLACRAGLDEDLVHELTRVLLDSLPEIVRAHAAGGGFDPEQAPAAPIPLHPGAARFYRERELSR
jgi:hypothetical protein